jgi:hypothetical protein
MKANIEKAQYQANEEVTPKMAVWIAFSVYLQIS